MERGNAEKEGFSCDYDTIFRMGKAWKREGSKVILDRKNLNKYSRKISEPSLNIMMLLIILIINQDYFTNPMENNLENLKVIYKEFRIAAYDNDVKPITGEKLKQARS